jgi:SlyX protein
MDDSSLAGARLLRLEEKIAYQDKTIGDLNEVVVALNRAVNELTQRLAAVERTVRGELGGREMPNEKPPHY